MKLPKILLIFVLLFSLSCSNDENEFTKIDPGFVNFISAYTSGNISKADVIRIQLAKDYSGNIELNKEIEDELFDFSPNISGKAYWRSSNTIEFVPDEWLESGEQYKAEFYLDELMDVEDKFETFNFQFSTINQSFAFNGKGLDTYDWTNLKKQKYDGVVSTADLADSSEVKNILTATQNGKALNVKWIHKGNEEHEFTLTNVARSEKASKIDITFNGESIGADETYEETIEVPALGDFKVTDMEIIYGEIPSLLIRFSDPLNQNQNLDGLITIAGVNNLSYEISGHEIRVFLPYMVNDEKLVRVTTGVKNIMDFKLPKEFSRTVKFEGIKPNVRLVNSGVILPTSDKGVVFPFEAVNLNAVDVYITKIYESNIIQFLQVNSFEGNYQMKRVASGILKKTINLKENVGSKNLNKWNRFYLNLDKIIEKEPGAIYQIELKFNQRYSAYACPDSDDSSLDEIEVEIEDDSWTEKDWSNDYYYDYYYDDYYYDDYYYDYDYRERDNPCHASYYRNRSIRTNILSSDLGITAKAGSDKVMHVFLNDLKTTEPLSGVNVEFYDFQQQLIGNASTNDDGMLDIKLDKKPFVLVAKSGNQTGYLRLRDGDALSLSKFDVYGEYIQKGIKGFTYAERGVWRPGDTIFASFILEDKNDILPDNHPVVFKLFNPKGQLVDKQVATTHINGFYTFTTKTNQEDITGNYRSVVKVGNRTFTKYFKVETIKPNRLKIYLEFPNEKVISPSEQKGNLSVKWLHGAIAKNLKAKIDLTLNPKSTSFEKFNGYRFDDPAKSFSTDQTTIFEGRTNAEGKADVYPSISVQNSAPGMLQADFVTKVFEEGGGYSVDRKTIDYSPFDSYVGVKTPKGKLYRGTIETDKAHTFDIASVDATGKPVSRDGLLVKVYKLNWRWWWSGGYQREIMNFISNSSSVPVYSETISTNSKGKADFDLTIEKPDWGRYLVRVTDPVSGHSTGQIFYADWPYYARANRQDKENATMLSFSTDKEKYMVGEEVKLTFPSPEQGRALVTVESGSKVLEKQIITTQKGETEYTINTTEEMAPNAYVCISLIQPHHTTDNDMPIRMYGIVPIEVENPDTHLNPEITSDEVFRPETTTTIKVNEKDGKPMTYTLAIVDEGLLDLTAFKTPQPWDYFYAREALGVKTWDLYDDVMGAFGSKIDKMFAVGGDGSGKPKRPSKANRFKPMVRVIGPFNLPEGKSHEHEISIPNYVGSVRIMVVAGEDERYGNAEKAVPVRSPLMVLGTLPRVVGPKETVKLPVNVFAMEKHVKNVTLSIKTNGMFNVVGSSTQNLSFSDLGDKVANFELNVKDKLGVAKVFITAKSGKEVAKYEVELDVRAPNPMITDVVDGVIDAGATWSETYFADGINGTNEVKLEISSIPPINLERRLNYLIRYPHGCIEQTTSSVFPQLHLSNLLKLDEQYQERIDRNVNIALSKLSRFQLSNGGFSYWPGNSGINDWGTNYAGHFIIEAEAKGYKLPFNMKKNWISYQSNRAKNWRYQNYGSWEYTSQAYRLYTLALAGAPELGAMNRLKEKSNLTDVARWRLAAAYVLVGRKDVAEKLISGVSTYVGDYIELSGSYGSRYRDEAMILETLVLMGKRTEAAKITKHLSEQLSSNYWMSTQTTAYSLLAISKYVKNSQLDSKMTYSYSVNGKSAKTNSAESVINSFTISKKKENGRVTIANKGKNVLFVKLITNKTPIETEELAYSKNLNMSVTYKTLEGKTIDPSRLEQGTDFMAEVTISNPSYKGYSEMALTQIFPSGWEIYNTRLDNFTSAIKNSYFDYQDIRDDRVYTYFYVGRGKSVTYRVILNATYLGRYYLPMVEAEAMYDNSITARTKGQWVEVVPAQGTVTQNNE